MNTVIFSALISAIVSLIGGLIVYSNTGKKLENYKKNMQSRDESYKVTMKIFKQVNSLYFDILDSDSTIRQAVDNSMVQDAMNSLSAADAVLFIPDDIYIQMKKFLTDICTYDCTISDITDLKRRGYSDSYDDDMKKILDNKENTLRKIHTMFPDIVKEIRDTYKIFPVNV